MNLFQLRDTHDNQLVPGFFPDKLTAKTARDTLNNGVQRYVVTPGPDHWNHEGGPVGQARETRFA